jgi:hypothetical protein
VKVVEGSEIYNFPIHHLVHFSCKKSSYYQSNSASPTFSGRLRRRSRAGAAPARARAALASGPPGRAPRAAALPEAASPEATRRPKADTRTEDRGSQRRRVPRPGTRAPTLPALPAPRTACCLRSGTRFPHALVSASPGGRAAGYKGRPLPCTGYRGALDE